MLRRLNHSVPIVFASFHIKKINEIFEISNFMRHNARLLFFKQYREAYFTATLDLE